MTLNISLCSYNCLYNILTILKIILCSYLHKHILLRSVFKWQLVLYIYKTLYIKLNYTLIYYILLILHKNRLANQSFLTTGRCYLYLRSWKQIKNYYKHISKLFQLYISNWIYSQKCLSYYSLYLTYPNFQIYFQQT